MDRYHKLSHLHLSSRLRHHRCLCYYQYHLRRYLTTRLDPVEEHPLYLDIHLHRHRDLHCSLYHLCRYLATLLDPAGRRLLYLRIHLHRHLGFIERRGFPVKTDRAAVRQQG